MLHPLTPSGQPTPTPTDSPHPHCYTAAPQAGVRMRTRSKVSCTLTRATAPAAAAGAAATVTVSLAGPADVAALAQHLSAQVATLVGEAKLPCMSLISLNNGQHQFSCRGAADGPGLTAQPLLCCGSRYAAASNHTLEYLVDGAASSPSAGSGLSCAALTLALQNVIDRVSWMTYRLHMYAPARVDGGQAGA